MFYTVNRLGCKTGKQYNVCKIRERPLDQSKRILELKRDKDVTILAHNYQLPEVQDIADYVGDSLGLAQKALTIKSNTVMMCGVYFMAETVAILNPEKTVLIPDMNAGCPLASFAPADMVRSWRKDYPDYAFVAYVNSTAEVKALVDVCCTSSNAVRIVRSLPNRKIVFLPDKNLGAYVKTQVPEKEIVLWPGFCVVHENTDLEALYKAKETHPEALVVAHPECPQDILHEADGICSTGQMFSFIESKPEVKEFIIATEWGIKHALTKRFPDRVFIEPSVRMECRNMKKITLDKVQKSLEGNAYRIQVDPEISKKAKTAIDLMLAMA